MNPFLIVIFATIGADLGALINYALARFLGRPIIYRFAESRLGHMCLLNSDKVKAEVEGSTRQFILYNFGTMIEIPRAALTADRMARAAEFFSFGTNDLTQMTFGFSRDDVGTFMGEYLGNKILDADPFQTIDTKSVGRLVDFGIQAGRSKRPDLKCGVCGEHGGDPASIHFFNKIGVDYVSCSPFRVPIARLAAAQAAIEQSK